MSKSRAAKSHRQPYEVTLEGQRLVDEFRRLGLDTVDGACRKADIPRSSVDRLIHGRAKTMSLRLYRRLEKLGVMRTVLDQWSE